MVRIVDNFRFDVGKNFIDFFAGHSGHVCEFYRLECAPCFMDAQNHAFCRRFFYVLLHCAGEILSHQSVEGEILTVKYAHQTYV